MHAFMLKSMWIPDFTLDCDLSIALKKVRLLKRNPFSSEIHSCLLCCDVNPICGLYDANDANIKSAVSK